MAFIKPYKEFAPTTEAIHKLISIALVAWNAALLPEDEQEEYIKKIGQVLPEEVQQDFYTIVREMIERKKTYFAQYERQILDYSLTETEDNYHVSVVSLIIPQD